MALPDQEESKGPGPTGPSQFLNPAQQQKYTDDKTQQMQEIQKAQIERLTKIVEKVFAVLKEEGVNVQDWDMVSKAVYAKINNVVDKTELSKLFKI